jgi:hypothetical protein
MNKLNTCFKKKINSIKYLKTANYKKIRNKKRIKIIFR